MLKKNETTIPCILGERCLFTLIELLVVISIIAVLASLLLPALQKAQGKGYSISCLSNTRQQGTGIAMYTNDFNGYFPHHGKPVKWTDNLIALQYVKLSIFRCAALKAPQTQTDEIGYGYNYYGAGSNYKSSDPNNALTNYCNSYKVKKPSAFYVLMDAVDSQKPDKGCYRIASYYFVTANVGNPHVRHKSSLNALFGDYHSSNIVIPAPYNALVSPGAYTVLCEKGSFEPY